MKQKQFSRRALAIGSVLVVGVALLAAACGGGTSSVDKTSTAGAGAAPTKAAVSTSTKSAASPAAASTTTGASTTPAASSSAGGISTGTTSHGEVLTDSNGMTLYVFKNDVAGNGKSACSTGACPTVWPAMTTTGGVPSSPTGVTGTFALITRDDGSMQVTYNGQPLYHFINDKAAGDTMGEGVAGLWTVAKP